MSTEVAQTILSQLGGHKFLVMTGANTLVGGNDTLSFKIGKNSAGISAVRITLNSRDLYDVSFLKIRNFEVKVIKEFNDVYCDELTEIFEKTTGLLTKL